MAIGDNALQNNTIAGLNVAVGVEALKQCTSGQGNIAIGLDAGFNVTTASDVICIHSAGDNVDGTTWIGGIFGVQSPGNALEVFCSPEGQLATVSSSRRFKKEIKSMDKASESILSLKPVTFYYKSDKTNTAQFGLIDEDVAEVNPDLIGRDKNGEIYSVRYDAVNAMLLNEFLKEHRTVQDLKSTVAKQEATIAQQQTSFQSKLAEQERQIAALTAGLQKVSAQLALTKSTPQTVLNNQ